MNYNEKSMYDEDDLEEEDTLKDKYLTFKISKEEYGIEIKFVIEIVGMQKITQVPDVDKYLKGVINLRGKIIPVIDVRLRFNLPEKEYGDRTCIVVVDMDNLIVGLIVDEVTEVIMIPEEQVELPPKTNKGSNSKYIQGIGKVGNNVKLLLNVEKLLMQNELMQIENLNEKIN